jgi:hypothetical protein
VQGEKGESSLLSASAVDSMTDTLSGLDGHAQTNGSRLTDPCAALGKVSSQRLAKKVAIGLMLFSAVRLINSYEMDLSQRIQGP